MRRIVLIAVSVAALASAAHAAGPASWNDVYQSFATWRPDSMQVADVASLLLQRENATIALEEGRVALAREIAGSRCAFVFQGRGTITYAPPTPIEREQMRRFYGTLTLRKKFTSLVVIATDSTLRELGSVASFRRDTIASLRRPFHEALSYVVDDKRAEIDWIEIPTAILDGEPGLFWAAAWEKGSDPVFFELDPYTVEGAQLLRTPEGEHQGLLRLYATEVVCQSRLAADTDTTARDYRPPFRVPHGTIDATLAPDLRMSATATFDIAAERYARHWAWFSLDKRLRVDAVQVDGKPAMFAQDRDGYDVLVRCEPPLEPGTSHTIQLSYKGQIFERDSGDRIYFQLTDWYPDPRFPNETTWDVRFHWPRDYQLLAAGARVAAEDGGATHSGRWTIQRPTNQASFEVGFLRGVEVRADSLPLLRVWQQRSDGAGRLTPMTEDALARGSSPMDKMTRDVVRGVRFYQHAYGAPAQDTIDAVEVPVFDATDQPLVSAYHSELGLFRMQMENDKLAPGVDNTPDFYRAHELAHQWWGVNVQPRTYHDAWLSEAFAEFSAIWYLQAGRQDTRSYMSALDHWSDLLFENHAYVLGKSQQSGPIWLGYRTNSSTTPGDYSLVIYEKGAWVLHMLRNMLLDLGTQDESRFREMMRSFYQSHVGGYVSTQDFERAVSDAFGEDMHWFFAQWVYGTDLPSYTFTSQTVPSPNGWIVRGHIEQANVPSNFRMPVILRLDYGTTGFARTRVWANGPTSDFELPPTKERPTQIVFNDLHSVLAQVKAK